MQYVKSEVWLRSLSFIKFGAMFWRVANIGQIELWPPVLPIFGAQSFLSLALGLVILTTTYYTNFNLCCHLFRHKNVLNYAHMLLNDADMHKSSTYSCLCRRSFFFLLVSRELTPILQLLFSLLYQMVLIRFVIDHYHISNQKPYIRIETLYFPVKVHSNHKRLEDACMVYICYSYHTCMGNEDPSYPRKPRLVPAS